MFYPLTPLIALGISVGICAFYIRRCRQMINYLQQQVQILKLVDQELNKQQLMEAQAIQDMAEAMFKNKYKIRREDKSEPIFKTPHGEA